MYKKESFLYYSFDNSELLWGTSAKLSNIALCFLTQVTSTEEWYEWFKDSLIPFVFPRYYSNGNLLNAYKRLFTSDDTQYRLGPMRLRQVRVEKGKM